MHCEPMPVPVLPDKADMIFHVHSAKELFRWRKKEKGSLPQRGGVKDFEPDDSWLQAKRLEAFYEEELFVLGEPRVEKR